MNNARGFTLVELLMVLVIVAVLLSIAVALSRNARVRGGEAVAIAALDAINQAQFAYMQTCGRQGYAPTLAALGAPPPGTASAYLSPDLTRGQDVVVKSGYTIQMSGTPATDGPQTCTGLTPLTQYYITADPTVLGVTGARYFGTNTDRVIFEDLETFVGKMPEKGPPARGSELRTVRAR